MELDISTDIKVVYKTAIVELAQADAVSQAELGLLPLADMNIDAGAPPVDSEETFVDE